MTRRVKQAVALLVVVACAACVPATKRFEELDGPLAPAVLYPDELGIDVSDLGVDVPAALGRVRPGHLRAHVDAIDGPRFRASPGGFAAADYVDAQLAAFGYTVARQDASDSVATMPNIYAEKAGSTCPEKLFVVGAHYDSVATTPGADDNASGVAGMLEIARVVQGLDLPITVRFAGFALEETGLHGSRAMANALRSSGVDVVGMVSLEMIGYTSTGKDPFIGSEQNFVIMVANPASESLARIFGAATLEYMPFFFAPAGVVDPATVGDVLRSDHAPFWGAGYSALLVTDLANFRNPNYHQSSDTIATLDFTFMANSTRATLAGLLALATVDANADGRPDVCPTA